MMNSTKTKKKFFDYDGTFYEAMGKIFDVLLVSVYWLIGCLPIITIGASCGALYRTCSRSIRRDINTVTKEFWHSYSQNFRQGFFLELICGGTMFLMLWNVGIVYKAMSGNISIFLLIFYSVLFAYALSASCYIFPALSRFNGDVGWFVKLGLYLSLKHFPATLLLLLLFAGCYFGVYFCIPTVVILPGVFSLASTFLIDPILDRHMPGQ